MELTDKQELFCHEYLLDLNKTRAYMRAFGVDNYGTAASEASRLTKNPNIYARIEELQKERADGLKLDAAYVLENLLAVAQRCQTAEPVKEFNYETKKLEETGEYVFDSNGANKALELLGKHLGMFKEKVDVTSGDNPLQGGLSQEQFQALLAAAKSNATPSSQG